MDLMECYLCELKISREKLSKLLSVDGALWSVETYWKAPDSIGGDLNVTRAYFTDRINAEVYADKQAEIRAGYNKCGDMPYQIMFNCNKSLTYSKKDNWNGGFEKYLFDIFGAPSEFLVKKYLKEG